MSARKVFFYSIIIKSSLSKMWFYFIQSVTGTEMLFKLVLSLPLSFPHFNVMYILEKNISHVPVGPLFLFKYTKSIFPLEYGKYLTLPPPTSQYIIKPKFK